MSTAAKAAQKVRTSRARGFSDKESLDRALKTYPAESRGHQGMLYAMFPDRSFLRILRDGTPQVLSHHTGKTHAEKIVRDVRASCSQCGNEVWCDMDGRPHKDHRFDLPGGSVTVCSPCQRNLVVRQLVGE